MSGRGDGSIESAQGAATRLEIGNKAYLMYQPVMVLVQFVPKPLTELLSLTKFAVP